MGTTLIKGAKAGIEFGKSHPELAAAVASAASGYLPRRPTETNCKDYVCKGCNKLCNICVCGDNCDKCKEYNTKCRHSFGSKRKSHKNIRNIKSPKSRKVPGALKEIKGRKNRKNIKSRKGPKAFKIISFIQ